MDIKHTVVIGASATAPAACGKYTTMPHTAIVAIQVMFTPKKFCCKLNPKR